MRRGQRLVGLLWRWHRRTGIAIFVFLVLLSGTGLVLNHSSGLRLDQRFVDWQWLLARYGDRSGELRTYRAGERWVTRSIGGDVFLDSAEIASCRGELLGAVAVPPDVIVAACEEELLLLTPDGELVEAITASTGLPAPLTAVGVAGEALVVQSAGDWLRADLDRLDFSRRVEGGETIAQQAAAELPAPLRAAIPAAPRWLTWERVLLDLHSGRLFGNPGVWVVDLVALLLVCISCSGVTMWWLRRRR